LNLCLILRIFTVVKEGVGCGVAPWFFELCSLFADFASGNT
jgi:hypothetical protein